jgi:hypothetical protein
MRLNGIESRAGLDCDQKDECVADRVLNAHPAAHDVVPNGARRNISTVVQEKIHDETQL